MIVYHHMLSLFHAMLFRPALKLLGHEAHGGAQGGEADASCVVIANHYP